MDSNEKNTDMRRVKGRVRFWRVWFAPVAAVGALAALVTGGLRSRPAPRLAPQQGQPPAAPVSPAATGTPTTPTAPTSRRMLQMAESPAAPARPFERVYTQAAVLGGSASPDQFRRSLAGIATGVGDHIYVLGDDEIRIFDPLLRRVRAWRAPESAACLAAGPDGRVYVGAPGRVEVFDAAGKQVSGFSTGEKDRPADVTAIKVFGADILVADANARIIRRHGRDGAPRGLVGNQSKTGSFMLPNRSLDIAVDTTGVVYATDTGRHQVTTWALDGAPLGKFGKFGMTAPEDFVGCCNPVNLALTPDGKVVTGEKMVARVKVFDPNGTLLAVIGPEHFDPSCIHIHLAVDSKGRILAADPVRREVKVFSLDQPPRHGERE